MLGNSPWILDVGSNDGGDSIRWLLQFREARVISFEPDKRAFQRLIARHASCEPSVRVRWYCEGYESEVLRGLSQKIGVISFEFTSEFTFKAIECLCLLRGLGYNSFNISVGETPQ